MVLLASDKFIISPLTATWKERTTRIATLKKSIAQGDQLLARDRAIRERWQHMTTNTLPSNLSVAEGQVLQAFERWSQESRISISSIKPQWKRAGDDYMTLECRADAFGPMPAITRFLYEVEKDPLAFKVEAVEITSRDNNGSQLSLALQVSALLLNPPEQ